MPLPPNYRWFDHLVAGSAKPLPEELPTLAAQEGIAGLVRLEKPERCAVTAQEVEAAGMADLHEPVGDMYVPTMEQAGRILGFIHGMVDAGKKVLVTCGVGAGRTGTIVACYFVDRGMDADQAISRVHCLQEPAQERFVRRYAASKAADAPGGSAAADG